MNNVENSTYDIDKLVVEAQKRRRATTLNAITELKKVVDEKSKLLKERK